MYILFLSNAAEFQPLNRSSSFLYQNAHLNVVVAPQTPILRLYPKKGPNPGFLENATKLYKIENFGQNEGRLLHL